MATTSSQPRLSINLHSVDNPFDLLTDSRGLNLAERAEYADWSEAQDAETPDPTICQCGNVHGDYSNPSGDYHICQACLDSIPFDLESDPEIQRIQSEVESDRRAMFQAAKAKLNNGLTPDSLTRRSELLIARWNLNGRYQEHLRDWYVDDQVEELEHLFGDSILFYKAAIDDRKQLRVWFSLDIAA